MGIITATWQSHVGQMGNKKPLLCYSVTAGTPYPLIPRGTSGAAPSGREDDLSQRDLLFGEEWTVPCVSLQRSEGQEALDHGNNLSGRWPTHSILTLCEPHPQSPEPPTQWCQALHFYGSWTNRLSTRLRKWGDLGGVGGNRPLESVEMPGEGMGQKFHSGGRSERRPPPHQGEPAFTWPSTSGVG